MEIQKINYFMSMAVDMAHEARKIDEVPIGAVMTNIHGDILAKSCNLKEKNQDACHHAEILAIKEASERLGSWRLIDCNIYVTLEPCPMCMSALSQARVKNVYFGAYDPKGGAISLGFNLHKDKRLNHKLNVYGGFKHLECSRLISNYFKQKRKNYNRIQPNR